MGNMWMVRAGEEAYAIEDFRSKKCVAIGWSDGNPDWTQFSDRDAIEDRLAKELPENTDRQNLVAASQIERFLREFEIGDRVISYDPSSRTYLVGKLSGSSGASTRID